MINPNNFDALAYNLGDILKVEVSPNFLKKISEGKRAYLTSLIYKWTQGENVEVKMTKVLDEAKKNFNINKYSNKTQFYLANKKSYE